LEEQASIQQVIFVCFGQHDYQIYQDALAEVLGK
jgi:hypothetical protein